MKRTLLAVVLTGLCTVAVAADEVGLPGSAAPDGASVYIISPADGATVGRQVSVRFGLRGMGVAPAGVNRPRTGHHHLLIDVKQLPPAGAPIPNDSRHLHFGGGQTETSLTLKPGTHTLQLELADAHHVPFVPALVSKRITVHVE